MKVGKLITISPIIFSLGLCISVARGERKIYWTDGGAGKIQRADLDAPHIEDLVTTGLIDPSGIALDLTANKIYWADAGTGKIQRADLDGGNVEDLVTELSSPYGIDLDLSSGKMYWTTVGEPSQEDGTIQRANLDGSGVETLVVSGLQDPRGIALDPGSFRMYWADRAANRIQRALMNGLFVEDIVTQGAFFGPMQVALDLRNDKLYWAGRSLFEGEGFVGRSDLNGSNVEWLVDTSTGVGGPAIEGLALSVQTGHMYWTQWGDVKGGALWRANLMGQDRQEIVGSLSFPRGIALDRTAAIPAVSQWGMVLLALVILFAGTILSA